MVRSKKVAAAVIAGVLTLTLGIGTALAASGTDPQATDAIKATPTQQEPAKADQTYTHEDLVKIAAEMGVDITGMTDDQIEAALTDYKLKQIASGQLGSPSREDLEKKAREIGVDPTGLTDDQLHQAIKQKVSEDAPDTKEVPSHDGLVRIAHEVGIDITGMTDAQIEAALREYKLKQAGSGADPAPSREDLEKKARAIGVDPTGLTDDQVLQALKQKAAEGDFKTNEPLTHEPLVQIAHDVGIDSTGMTDVQIEAALREAKMARAAAMGEPIKPVPTDEPAK